MSAGQFLAFSRMLHDHAGRSAKASADLLRTRYTLPNLRCELFALFFASSALAARKRYSDYVVRALIARAAQLSAGAESELRGCSGTSLKDRVTELEKAFLKGHSEPDGNVQMASSSALLLVNGIFGSVASDAGERRVDDLIDVLFGSVGHEARRHDMFCSIILFLAARIAGHLDCADYLVDKHLIEELAGQFVPAGASLPPPAQVQLHCALPAWGPDSSLASAYAVHYRVVGRFASGRLTLLDRGTETHLAPDGPRQALARTITHLRHRWYPRATTIHVLAVEELAPGGCAGVRRHFSVYIPGVEPHAAPFPVCGVDAADALASSFARAKGYTADSVVLKERPLLLGGRKPRPKLFLDRFMASPTADAPRTSARRTSP